MGNVHYVGAEPLTFERIEEILTGNMKLELTLEVKERIQRCRDYLDRKIETQSEPLYGITPDGRVCLADFYVKIPSSLREEISLFVKNNRTKYKKRQECNADYYMNKDGTYTVFLKIVEPSQPLLELKLVVPNRQTAKNIYKKWEEKAGNVYATVYDCLVD